MRSVLVGALLFGLALWTPQWSSAQDAERQSTGSGTAAAGKTMTATTSSGETVTVTTQEKPGAKPRVEPEPVGRWVRALTNVQVELTITDQSGAKTAEKKTVTMVVSSGSWGRIRSAGAIKVTGTSPPVVVDLNVDARPMVSVDGPIQLELTIAYSPLGSSSEDASSKPPTVNQSLTVVLQSGRPLVISQAADPVGDRKIIVEAKATVLK